MGKSQLLYKALEEYKNLNRISFHTPGHKNVAGDLFSEIFNFDFTELPDTDSLYEANGVILNSEKAMSNVFGTRMTFFSAGGCTLCIQAMIRQVSKGKKKIIIGRTIHKSAINTIALLGLDPVFVMPRENAGPFLPGRICAEDVRKTLEEHKDACALYVTSPDYFGVISDISSISKECKKFGIPLIVDNAHGTHLKFLSKDIHPISLGATMSADSAHKTLPVLTGGALLQVNDEEYCDGVRESMSLFGSTSPSYPVMASLDLCRSFIESCGYEMFAKLERRVRELTDITESLGFRSPKGQCDPTRISLCADAMGISGTEIAEVLRKNGIEPEYANKSYVVLIPTPMNSDGDFERLIKILKGLKESFNGKTLEKTLTYFESFRRIPEKVMLPRDAMFAEHETVKLVDSVNRICCETIAPCPPGIPVVMPGERISYEVVEFLKEYRISFIKVLK